MNAAMNEEQARETLLGNGVPEAVLGAWHDEGSPLRLSSWSKPRFNLAEELERHVPGLRGLCPMFEQNGEAVVGLLPRDGRFVRYYYEDGLEGDAAIELLGQGYQQFAGTVLLSYEEAGLSELFDELVSLLRFERAAEFRALLDADPYDEAPFRDFLSGLAAPR
jgi:hypothetical protein